MARAKLPCVSALIIILLMSIHTASGDTLFVGSGEAYTTIQAAIDAAGAFDVIVVRDGTYVENLFVDNCEQAGESSSGLHLRDGLTIRSENGPDGSTIQAADADLAVVELRASEVVVEGFTLTGATATTGDGVMLHGAQQCRVQGNRIVDNYRGVRAYQATGNVIDGNDVSGCTGNAIVLVNHNTHHVVSHNTIHDGCYHGISVTINSDENIVEANTITGATNNGIDLSEYSQRNVIRGNVVADCGYEGIYLNQADANTIVGNTCTGNHIGINMNFSSDDNVVYLNHLADNTFSNATTSDFADSSWYAPDVATYQYGQDRFTGLLGNHFGDYAGVDDDGDGIGETVYDIYTLGDPQQDLHPLIDTPDHYTILAPPAVHNMTTDEWFYTIQEAIDDEDTLDGQLIQVGSGTYHENVDVHKSVVLQAPGSPEDTVVIAADPSDHVFDVSTDSVALVGFGLSGATGADAAGIHIASGVANTSISDVASDGNTYAVLSDTAEGGAISWLHLARFATTVSLNMQGGIGIREVLDAPPSRADQVSMGRYVEIEEVVPGATFSLWVHYEESDPGEFNESSLRMWRWDGVEWWQEPGSGADPDNNRVADLNVAAFGIFAPMGVEQHGAIWIGPSGGQWHTATHWSTVAAPSNAARLHWNVFIDAGNGQDSRVLLENGEHVTIDNLTIDPDDTLQIGENGGATLHIATGPGAGVVANNGSIELASPHTGTLLKFADGAILGGIGEVVLYPQGPNYIQGEAETDRLTHGAGHTIRGGRRLGNNFMALTNHGTIDADEPSFPLEVNLTDSTIAYNTGVMEASDGGTLRLIGSNVDNTGGVIRGLAGSVAQVATGAVVTGGQTTSQDNGVVELRESGLVIDITNTGTLRLPNGGGAGYMRGTITNEGTIELASEHYSTDLYIDGDVTFHGDGEIVIGPAGPNHVRGNPETARLTNSATHTIRGGRQLGKNFMALTNHGTIDADEPSFPLEVNLTDSTIAYNTGVMEASDGGTLRLIGSNVDNTGGVIRGLAGSVAQVATGAVVTGGQTTSQDNGVVELRESGLVIDITNTGTLRLPNGGGAGYMRGTITNEGTIELASEHYSTDLYIDGDVTFHGDGEIVIGPAGPNHVRGNPETARLTNSATHTIRGARDFGYNRMSFTNEGTIDADDPAYALTIDMADGLINHNTGIMQASNGGTMKIVYGTYDNTDGVIMAKDGSTVQLGNASVYGGRLQSEGNGIVQLTYNANIADIVSDACLVIPNGNGPGRVSGTITNLRTFVCEGGHYGTNLILTDDALLTGPGTFAISGHNDIDGAYTLTNGAAHTMRILGGNDIRSSLTNEGLLDVPEGAALLLTQTYTPATGSHTCVNGTITAPGTTSLMGTLTGDGTYAGHVDNASGIVEPGSGIGRLTVTGSFVQTEAGTLAIEIGGTTPSDTHDVLTVQSTAMLGGTLRVALADGYVPALGETFTVLTAQSITATFDEVVPTGRYQVDYTPAAVTLTVAELPGDWDGNDQLDLADYAVFADCMAGPDATPTPSEPGVTPDACLEVFDFGMDGDVDTQDYATLQAALQE